MSGEKAQTAQQRRDKRSKLLRKIVNMARNIITYEVGLSVGVRRMELYLNWLEQDGRSLNFPVFREYNRSVVAIPSGEERLNCSLDALQRYDELLYPINREYQPRILYACIDIIKQCSLELDKLATD